MILIFSPLITNHFLGFCLPTVSLAYGVARLLLNYPREDGDLQIYFIQYHH